MTDAELEQLALEALDSGNDPPSPKPPSGELKLKRKSATPRQICEDVLAEELRRQRSA